MSKPKESHKARQTADGTHLAPDAKSFCVRIPGDFKGKLSLSDIATAIGVATSSLSRWADEADPGCRFPAPRCHRCRLRVCALWSRRWPG
jgi:hypothetical protein